MVEKGSETAGQMGSTSVRWRPRGHSRVCTKNMQSLKHKDQLVHKLPTSPLQSFPKPPVAGAEQLVVFKEASLRDHSFGEHVSLYRGLLGTSEQQLESLNHQKHGFHTFLHRALVCFISVLECFFPSFAASLMLWFIAEEEAEAEPAMLKPTMVLNLFRKPKKRTVSLALHRKSHRSKASE